MSPAVVSDLHGSLLETNVQVVNTDRFLPARFYRSGAWSDPETLSSTVTPGVRQRMCVDTEGLFWLIYTEGFSPPMRLLARYYKDGSWSEPETVASGGVYYSPAIVSTYSSQLWAVWQDGLQNSIQSARRLGRPGASEGSSKPQAPSSKLRCYPNPAIGRVLVLFPPSSPTPDPRHLTPVLSIYDAQGRLVRILQAVGCRPSAVSSVTWDGTDQAGRQARPGVYYLRAAVTGATAKVILE